MALIYFPRSGGNSGPDLPLGDPEYIPLKDDPGLCGAAEKVLSEMILSASGWRGVFAPGGESSLGEISPAHSAIAAAAALVFADYLKKRPGLEHPAVLTGMDTRPTGQAIADVMIRALLSEGCRVRFAFIAAAPEIMAHARSGETAGFVYISASHNPIGHNGLKFGLSDGGVLPGEEAAALIAAFRAYTSQAGWTARAAAAVSRADPAAVRKVYSGAPAVKAEALRAYMSFTREVAGGGDTGAELEAAIIRGIKARPLEAAVDFNGSARTMSIDRDFLSSLGIGLHSINDRPRQIVHRIVPEGESLEPCRSFLEELHGQNPAAELGYVPDCDGDRGNLVFWDEAGGRARSLEAQELFALVCVSELAHLVWTGELRYDNKGNALDKAAVVVNDPTSMRIDRIAAAFDVSVFRSEVGEANVVGLARKLRDRGYKVRILGEGSAGGTITHPSAVRDPMDTLLAIIKLLTVRSEGDRKGFFELWCDLSDQAETYHPDFCLSDIIASLPAFVSTGAYSPEALLQVRCGDHGLLKDRYQEIFLREWEERKDQLKTRYGIVGWEAAAYQGTGEQRGLTRFGAAGRGGLRIIFFNEAGRGIASIWMRGSATEQVFRIMADAEGQDKRLERDLIEWQRRLVGEADSL
ncbi:MAG: phosphatidylglycerol lysyltransferase [Treponema sp.]|jgi:phosphoglucomutase|nr:phosphatidylglycerol lysyltransferase [Treponema sp.]